MSVEAYCEHVARTSRNSPDLYFGDGPRNIHDRLYGTIEQKPFLPAASDVVEFDQVQILEGKAAELSNRVHLSAQERAELDRAQVLTP
jgi:hypothetical protein